MRRVLLLLVVLSIALLSGPLSADADLVIMKNGLRHKCKVIEDDPAKDHITVRVTYGSGRTGTISIHRRNIERIDLDYDSRLERLEPDDFKGYYELALYCIEQGMAQEAAALLRHCAGKKDVPANAWLALANLELAMKRTVEALNALEKYVVASPDDKEAAKLLEELRAATTSKTSPVPSTSPDPAKTPEPSPQPSASPSASPGNGVTVQLIEGLEAADGWTVASWAGRGQLSVRDTEGNKVLVFDYDPVTFQKSACYKVLDDGIPVDKFSAFSASVFNTNDNAVQLSVALLVGDSTTSVKYFESPLKLVPTSKWTKLEFDLTGSNWKSAPKWEHNLQLPKTRIWAVNFLVYPGRETGAIYFDEVSFTAGGK